MSQVLRLARHGRFNKLVSNNTITLCISAPHWIALPQGYIPRYVKFPGHSYAILCFRSLGKLGLYEQASLISIPCLVAYPELLLINHSLFHSSNSTSKCAFNSLNRPPKPLPHLQHANPFSFKFEF